MNYNETVEKVMMLLKEKEVCSSSQKSHKDCYESLGLFIKQRDGNYSEVIRESWLAEIKNELPRQRYAVWVQYAYQLEALMTYLEDGHCSLSNNLSENAIRPFTVGRNYVFKNIKRKTGCSVPVLREPLPVPLCILWLRWQKQMI